MHETMVRLYEAAKAIRGLGTQSEIANLLNVASQNVNNWEKRGMSSEVMLSAQEILGCNAVWLRSGHGPMLVGELYPVPSRRPDELADSLKRTAETASELLLLTVYRLSNQANRQMLDVAVEAARADLSLTYVLDKR